jgi:predicted metal-binding protein
MESINRLFAEMKCRHGADFESTNACPPLVEDSYESFVIIMNVKRFLCQRRIDTDNSIQIKTIQKT